MFSNQNCMKIKWTVLVLYKMLSGWKRPWGHEWSKEKDWKEGRMVYCLAVWCPHRATSCPLVAVEDSLSSTFTPTAREWQVPAASVIPLSKASQIIPLLSRPSGCLNLKRGPPVIRGYRESEKKLKTRRSHQIFRGLWAPIIQSLSFQLGWSPNE